MELLESFISHGGEQKVFSHYSKTNNCNMKFSIFLPKLQNNKTFPIIWYLSGLTCSHSNVTEKGEYRKKASELGVAIICPDTSPRGEDVPDEKDNWQFGSSSPQTQRYQMIGNVLLFCNLGKKIENFILQLLVFE
jgi:S-formylglutathione hydrolase